MQEMLITYMRAIQFFVPHNLEFGPEVFLEISFRNIARKPPQAPPEVGYFVPVSMPWG